MTIHLTSDREQFVRSLMQDGGFASETDVVEEALRLLEERYDRGELAELRREIAIGIEEADRGELAPFDPQTTLARIRATRANGSEDS